MKKIAFNRVMALLLASSTLAFSQFALAHAHLKTAIPAENRVVDSFLHNVNLTFTEGIEPAFSGVEVLDAQNSPLSTQQAHLTIQKPNKMVVQFDPPLQSGRYQVNWHVLSIDGHKTEGSYTFTIK